MASLNPYSRPHLIEQGLVCCCRTVKRCLHHLCALKGYFHHRCALKGYFHHHCDLNLLDVNPKPFKLTISVVQLFNKRLQDHALWIQRKGYSFYCLIQRKVLYCVLFWACLFEFFDLSKILHCSLYYIWTNIYYNNIASYIFLSTKLHLILWKLLHRTIILSTSTSFVLHMTAPVVNVGVVT